MIKVAVDIDGVLAALHERFLHLVNKDFQTEYTLEDLVCWKTERALPVFKGIKKKHSRKTANNLIWRYFDLAWLSPQKMPQIPGAANAMQELHKFPDWQVHLVSARRIDSVTDVIRWIGINEIKFQGIMILDAFSDYHDKAQLGYDVYVDDSPLLARAISRRPEQALFLFDYPYNQGKYNTNIIRVEGWPDTMRYLRKIRDYGGVETFLAKNDRN